MTTKTAAPTWHTPAEGVEYAIIADAIHIIMPIGALTAAHQMRIAQTNETLDFLHRMNLTDLIAIKQSSGRKFAVIGVEKTIAAARRLAAFVSPKPDAPEVDMTFAETDRRYMCYRRCKGYDGFGHRHPSRATDARIYERRAARNDNPRVHSNQHFVDRHHRRNRIAVLHGSSRVPQRIQSVQEQKEEPMISTTNTTRCNITDVCYHHAACSCPYAEYDHKRDTCTCSDCEEQTR